MAVQSRIAVVTGANKGIGLAIVRNLALQYPSSPLRSGPLLVYLTARSAERGAAAVKELNAQLKDSNVLADNGGDTTISFHALDISQPDSVEKFRDYLKEQHPEGVDFVINNAGVAFQGFDSTIVKDTLATNYYGTLNATRSLLPLIRDGGRLVNVSSISGLLKSYSSSVRDAFHEAAKTDVPAVTALMEAFAAAVAEGKEKEAGYPSAAYAVSKAGETAFTKVIAMEESKNGRGVLVNACCPGYVVTDTTRGGGQKTTDEGARTPVMLALNDISGKTGGFWRDEKIHEW